MISFVSANLESDISGVEITLDDETVMYLPDLLYEYDLEIEAVNENDLDNYDVNKILFIDGTYYFLDLPSEMDSTDLKPSVIDVSPFSDHLEEINNDEENQFGISSTTEEKEVKSLKDIRRDEKRKEESRKQKSLFSSVGEVFSEIVEKVVEFLTPIGETPDEEIPEEIEEEKKVPLTGNENKPEENRDSEEDESDKNEETQVEEIPEGGEKNKEDEIEEKENGEGENSDYEIPSDYISYWKFEGNSIDEGGIFKGSERGNTTYTQEGKVGLALKTYAGAKDVFFIQNPPQSYPHLFDFNKGFTFAFWAKADARINGRSRLVYKWNGGNAIQVRINKHSSQETYAIEGSVKKGQTTVRTGEEFSGEYPTLNEWTHVSFSWDGTMQRFYINGEVIDEEESTILYPVNITFSDISRNFNGSMDELLFYNRGLSEEEVSNVYCALGGDC